MESLKDKHILLVEDEAMLAIMLEDMLTDMGCIVVVAGTVEAGLKAVSNLRFDAAVLDINLGGTAVFPVADALVDHATPFLFSTGYGTSGLYMTAYRDRHALRKPFPAAVLQQALLTLLTTHRRC
jgi:DNA-binding response OmpR family regulator